MGRSIWLWKRSKMRTSSCGLRSGKWSRTGTNLWCSVSYGQFKYKFSFRKWQVTVRMCKVLWVHPLGCRMRLKCDGTRAETGFSLSAKRKSPFKSAGVSFNSTTGSRGVRISSSNAGCTMFRGSVKSIGYPLHSPVSPSLPLPCVTVCRHISTDLYKSG